VAEIHRGYVDPPQSAMRFKGKPVIGLGVVMAPGGNVQALGQTLDKTMDQIVRDLPLGPDGLHVFPPLTQAGGPADGQY